MNEYDFDTELGTNLVCVTCGDSLESWEINALSVCFICECLEDQALTHLQVCYNFIMELTKDNQVKLTNRQIADAIKLEAGCELCGYNTDARALQFDHIDPSTKYTTKSGKTVHPSDLIKGTRYGIATVLAEIAKCRVLCANCHAVHTHRVQRA